MVWSQTGITVSKTCEAGLPDFQKMSVTVSKNTSENKES